MAARIAQSVYQLATGWTFRVSNTDGGEVFRTRPNLPWDPSSLLYSGFQVFPGVKSAGTWCWPHHSLVAPRLRMVWSCTSALPPCLHRHVVGWPLHYFRNNNGYYYGSRSVQLPLAWSCFRQFFHIFPRFSFFFYLPFVFFSLPPLCIFIIFVTFVFFLFPPRPSFLTTSSPTNELPALSLFNFLSNSLMFSLFVFLPVSSSESSHSVFFFFCPSCGQQTNIWREPCSRRRCKYCSLSILSQGKPCNNITTPVLLLTWTHFRTWT